MRIGERSAPSKDARLLASWACRHIQPRGTSEPLNRSLSAVGYQGFESLPLRQQHKKSNKINRSLIVIGFSPPDWYTRVVHIDPFDGTPWKHPDSGYYWFRKRVPDDLRDAIGKREEW